MTTHDRDKVIAAASDAGFSVAQTHWDDERLVIERFYAIAFEAGRVAEREECAKVCEEIRVIVDGNHPWTALHVQNQCIDAIRARSTK
jgi:hypothetical protein